MRPSLEIGVSSATGARIALHGGADRIELCSALELGGVTPSAGLIAESVAVGLPVHVLIRCRAGDFVYTDDEVETMRRDVRVACELGASGVVIGALNVDGMLDEAAVNVLMRECRAARPGVEVTLHRAVDRAADPVATVVTAERLGLDRVLTSGASSTVDEGLGTIARMRAAAEDIQLMTGGGLRIADIPAALRAGADVVHLSAKRVVAGVQGNAVSLGVRDEGDIHLETDRGIVAEARRVLDGL